MSDFSQETIGKPGDNRRQYDLLLNKVIEVTENNLRVQNEYLNQLNQIRNSLILNERDHQDVKDQLGVVTNNTFDILNRMNRATNEKIIELLEVNEDTHTDFKYRWEQVYNITKTLNDKLDGIGILKEELKIIKDASLNTKETFSFVQKILFAIFIVLIGVQLITTTYRSASETASLEQLQLQIHQTIKEDIVNELNLNQ